LNNSLFFIKVYFFIKKEWKERITLCIDLRILSCCKRSNYVHYVACNSEYKHTL